VIARDLHPHRQVETRQALLAWHEGIVGDPVSARLGFENPKATPDPSESTF
jgi:hypothetical protein